MNPKTFDDLKSQLAELRREGEERQARRLAGQTGYSYVDLTKTPVSVEAVRVVAEAQARDAKLAVIEIKNKKLAVASQNPELPASKKVIEELEAKGFEVKLFIVSVSGLEKVWPLYKFVKPEAEGITGKVIIKEEKIAELIKKLFDFDSIKNELKRFDLDKVSPTEVIEIILGGSLSLKASDMHLEASEGKGKLRLRVDGVLHDVFDEFPIVLYDRLVSRIKLLSGLKLNIKDISQDGRFTINLGKSAEGGKEIEIRVSVIPAEFGENIVMRILDPEVTSIGLAQLGLRKDDLEIVDRQLAKPNGLILNTGPTGSGKTSTLYAFLRHVNNPEIKIITLEDPIEYRLEGVEQTQVDEESGYTFANGLRAIVRQDPDIILVGEIRDKDTSDVALQSALTGHLVLATLHTNDAIGAVPRLVNLGANPATIGPALNLIIAQRLVRRLCQYCKKETEKPADLVVKIKKFFDNLPKRVDKSKYENYKIYSPSKCDKCHSLGYKSRVGIFEFLEGTPEFEEEILKGVSEISLKKLSEAQGMVTMQEDGVLKVLDGETSFEEVEGATGKIEWK